MNANRFRVLLLFAVFSCMLTFGFAQTALAAPSDDTLQAGSALSLMDASEEGSGDSVSDSPNASEKTDISNASIVVADSVFTGAEVKPSVSVTVGSAKLSAGADFTVSYSNNINAGTANVSVAGIGNYKGSATANFSINRANMSSTKISVKNKAYTGKALKPSVVAKLGSFALKQGTDFSVKYKSNKNVGTATVILFGKGNMAGKVTTHFKVTKANAKKFKVAKIAAYKYTGEKYKPIPKVSFNGKKLKLGRDYKLAYKANRNAGIAKIIVKGKGRFKGQKTVKFKIKPVSLSNASVSSISSKKYTGSEIEPSPTVRLSGKTLKNGRDYELSYSGNVDAGTAKIVISGIGNYKGIKRTTFKIWKPAAKKSSSSASSGSGTVYWTPGGSVYHYSRSCPTLSRSRTVYSGSPGSSGKSRGCKVCG